MNGSPATTLLLAAAPGAARIVPIQLDDTEREVVYDIFTIARYHSRECQEKLQQLRSQMATDPDALTDSDEFGNYLWAVGHLYAALAPAAVSLVPILAPIDKSDGARIELLDRGRENDLERFMRPIFDEAGIAEDFAK